MTYDDTRLRWNGADLLTRVARRFSHQENTLTKHLELNVQASYIFFPLSSQNIRRYISKFFTILYVLLHIHAKVFSIHTLFEHEHGNIFKRETN
jgi:hypothetical protein